MRMMMMMIWMMMFLNLWNACEACSFLATLDVILQAVVLSSSCHIDDGNRNRLIVVDNRHVVYSNGDIGEVWVETGYQQ